jgi:uncharacterized coiled-coil protein SlyX
MEDLEKRVEFLEEIIGDILDAVTDHDEGMDSQLNAAFAEIWRKFVKG